MLVDLALGAIDGEELGRGPRPDLLCVSFSSNDATGHRFGPSSSEVQDITLRLDRELERFLNHLKKSPVSQTSQSCSPRIMAWHRRRSLPPRTGSMAQQVLNGFHSERSGDVVLVPKPGPAPWSESSVAFGRIRVWQYDDPGDVRGLLTNDQPDSIGSTGERVKEP